MLSKLAVLTSLILAATARPGVLTPGANDGLCLTATSQSNGAAVAVETCAGRTEQVWTVGNGALSTFGTKKCLDVTGGADKDGTLVQVWDCVDGNANQQWTYTSDNKVEWTGHNKCLDLTDGAAKNGTKIQIWTCITGNANQVWNAGKAGSVEDAPTLLMQVLHLLGSAHGL